MSQPGTKPTADDFFGVSSQQGQLPTADQFFAQKPATQPLSGPLFDQYFSAPAKAEARILNAFGQGAKDGWGSEPLGLSDETKNFLSKGGMLGDYLERQGGTAKAFNEALFRPMASYLTKQMVAPVTQALDLTQRVFGSGIGGAERLANQAGVEIGQPDLGRDTAGMIEYETSRGDTVSNVPHVPRIDILKARSLGVIGEGEGGYFGTVQPTPESMDARAQAVKDDLAARVSEQGASAPKGTTTPAQPASAPPQPPDIHTIARQIAPDTFTEYDALSQRKDTFRSWLSELGQQKAETPEVQAIQGRISTILEKVNGVEDRLTNAASARLETARSDLDDLMRADTPEMASIRQEMMRADFRMRDLAPDVASAYRKAQAAMPEVTSGNEMPSFNSEVQPGPEATPRAVVAAESAPVQQPAAKAPSGPANENVVGNIVSDVSQKLQAAGRPAEEADAAAALVQAHYQARSQRFGGALGTPEELYTREGAEIKGAEAGGPKGVAAGKTAIKDGRAIVTLFKRADASTFMHETGHQWLEELMRDAADEDAPADLKADVASVREWIGAKEGEAIPTRGHEKFARGFERYLMEGRAPTQELAGVFAKFKAWLTQIYQTVSKLRSPITDDIRNVFDRLIATPGAGPVIAADRVAPTLADIHETDAEITPPEHAAEVADRVRGEIDATLKEKAPEIYAELNPESQDGGIAGEDPNAPSGGDETAAAGEDAGLERVGAEPARGDAAKAESGDVRNEPVGPNAKFTEPDSDLVDKAGNIRIDNLNTPEDVSEVIRESARIRGDFVPERRGVISDAQAFDLADALGMDADKLNLRKIGQAFNSEEILAARKLLIQSATTVRDAMTKAVEGSDADVMAYAEAKARHLMIQGHVAGVTAEAGRALRAFRELEGSQETKVLGEFLETATGKTLFQLRAEANAGRSLETPQQISKFMQDSQKPKFSDMLLEYWVNGLISGPATHTTYSVGNALMAMWKAVPETGVASLIGVARKALGDETPRVMPGEVGAQLYGMLKGSREGIVAAGQAARTGMTTLLPGEEHADFSIQQGAGAIPGKLGTVIRLPSRAVATIHSFFRAVGYSQAKASLAYRAASEEGLAGDAFARRVAELSTNPPEDMMATAREQSTEQTLMGKGGEFTQWLAMLSNKPILGVPLLKFVMPFVKIGSNIMSQALLERTPLGVFDKDIRGNILGHNGPVARDTQIARIAVGSALGATAVGLAAQGLVTGGGPSDPRQAAIYAQVHGPAYSVRIGDTWYGIHRLGPLAMIFGTGADIHDLGHDIDEHGASQIASLMVSSVTKGLLDETWMRGPADLIQALEDPDRYGAAYVRNQLSSFTPFSVGMSQIARAVDPDARQARTIMDSFKAKIPWLSETLLPRRDIFGEPMANKEALGLDGLSAIYETRTNTDPVYKAMEDANVFPAQAERKIRGVQLTDQQYDDYVRISGRTMHMQLASVVSMPGFDQVPPEMRRELITKVISGSREAARSIVMMQSAGGPNDIIRQATDSKLALLRGTK